MPRLAVVVIPQHRGQGGMRGAAGACPRLRIRQAADQRVREGHLAGGEPHQPRRLGVRQLPGVGPGLPARRRDHGQLGPRVRRRDEQGLPRGPGQRLDPARERALQPSAGSERELERGHAGPLASGQRGGQLDQGQRVARRGLRDRRRDRRRQLRGALPQKLGRRGVVDRPDGQIRQPDALGRVPRVPRGQHDRERPAGPPGDVLDALPGGRVDPLDVVHHDEDRPLPGLGPQHAERGDAYRQAVTWRGRLQRQRAHQRGGLRPRQRVQPAEHGVEKFGQRGESALRLGLGPAGPHDRDRAVAALDQRLEQGRLADPGLSVHDQGAALTAYERGEESVEPGPFGHPADDHRDAPEKGENGQRWPVGTNAAPSNPADMEP